LRRSLERENHRPVSPEDINPYAPPVADGGPSPSPESASRSAVPRVFGVLSITFSGLFVLLVAVSAAIGVYSSSARSGGAPAPSVREQPMHPVGGDLPHGAMVCLGLDVIGGTIALLVIGIGQVRYRRWAARGSVIWSVVVLALFVGSGAWTAIATPLAALSLLPTAVVLLPYPVLLWIFFSRERVVASMTHGPWERRRPDAGPPDVAT
jgi:hypothetical protein